MALNVSGYASDVSSVVSETLNTPDMFGQGLAQATSTFWISGTGPGGASLIPDAGIPTMQTEFANAIRVPGQDFNTPAKMIAQGFFDGVGQVVGTGSGYGTHVITTPFPFSELASGIASLFQSLITGNIPADVFAQQFAALIQAYTTQCIMQGQLGPVTVIGPIS